MNKHVKEFLHRGLTCAAGGPLVLTVIYAILAAEGVTDPLSPAEVSTAIFELPDGTRRNLRRGNNEFEVPLPVAAN